MDCASGIQLPDCSKLAINLKIDNDIIIFQYDVLVKLFWRGFVSLVKVSSWSKLHVYIITGSGVMTIFFYERLTRNLEIGNTPVSALHNVWRLGQVRDTKFGMNVSSKMLLHRVWFNSSIVICEKTYVLNAAGVWGSCDSPSAAGLGQSHAERPEKFDFYCSKDCRMAYYLFIFHTKFSAFWGIFVTITICDFLVSWKIFVCETLNLTCEPQITSC